MAKSQAATSRARRNKSGKPRPWDRRAAETAKAYAAFRTYCEMGACRSVREALRQTAVKQRCLGGCGRGRAGLQRTPG